MNEELSIRLSGDIVSPLASSLVLALRSALALESKLPDWTLTMPGMSGRKYRRLINNLISSIPHPRYLEVGSWAGSTACSAMFGNRCKVTCIDNWAEFGGPKDEFFKATGACRSNDIDFAFIESDFRAVDYKTLGTFNVYLFDGPHKYEDQYDGIRIAQPALDREYIQIVDDWNWADVRRGTLDALRDGKSEVIFGIEIRTTQDNTHPTRYIKEDSEWHNGYNLAVVRKTL